MKKTLLSLLLVFLLLLSACGTDTPQSAETPTEAPTEALQNNQTDGMMELPTNPVQSNLKPVVLEISAEERCAATSNCKIAETENGYYMRRSEYLFYADKSDLSNWVLVCNEPECQHKQLNCPAYLGPLGGLWVVEDGIYYVAANIKEQELGGDYFIKINLDASSPNAVYTDTSLTELHGCGVSNAGIKDSYCRGLSSMNEDGSWNCRVMQVDHRGVKTLFSATYPPTTSGYDPMPTTYNTGQSVRGDVIIRSWFPLDGTPDENKEDWANRGFDLYYQVHNDTIREIKLNEVCDLYGAYISGDSLWHYHMNDGFYYMNLSTGDEVKIADAAYENAYGHCVDGKHMVECSLSVPGYTRDAAEPHMRYFDGEVWHELELPEHWNPQYKFRVLAGASDRIIFTVDSDEQRSADRQQELGYIMLGEETVTICDKYPTVLTFD